MKSYLQIAIKKQIEQKDTIIYNLILMLNEYFDTMDIDNLNFIEYICKGSGLPEEEYRKILKGLLLDEEGEV